MDVLHFWGAALFGHQGHLHLGVKGRGISKPPDAHAVHIQSQPEKEACKWRRRDKNRPTRSKKPWGDRVGNAECTPPPVPAHHSSSLSLAAAFHLGCPPAAGLTRHPGRGTHHIPSTPNRRVPPPRALHVSSDVGHQGRPTSPTPRTGNSRGFRPN